jgi:amino acid adenylation domain-containing protein
VTTSSPRVLSEAKRRVLARYLRGEGLGGECPIPPRDPARPIPLSWGQQLLWLHMQLAPELPVYNEPITIHRRGPLDVPALEWSLGEILRRHEAWRTCFRAETGEPVQVVLPPPQFSLPFWDLRGLPREEREAEALRLATEDARHAFDLSKDLLIRGRLVRMAEEEHRLYLTLHHIIFDGVSTYSVLLPELTALYEARVGGRPSPLGELQIQYGDYACWERGRGEEELRNQMAYWRRMLEGAPPLELPTDRPRPPTQSFRGAMQPLALETDRSKGLRALSRREGVTLFMTLLAAFATLLHRYTGQEDLVLGTVTAGRRRRELQGLLGFFLNPLILRLDLSGNPSFRGLLKRVRGVTLDALSNEEVPFERLVTTLKPQRDASRNPLYQVLFSLEPPLGALREGWTLTQNDIETGTAKLDLYLELDDRPQGLVGRFMYNTDLFAAGTIRRMLGHWETLLGGVLSDPSQPVSKLPLLTEGERRGFSQAKNAAGPQNPFVRFEEGDETLSGRFERMASAHADRTALETAEEKWPYGLLNRRANQIARGIRKAKGGERVALLLNHDATMVASLLGALKAGKTYVPVDPRYPKERTSSVLRDCGAEILLTDRANLPLARALSGLDLLVVDELGREESGENVDARTPGNGLAYLLYTSGSTGHPKGVMQTHENVLGFIKSYTNALHIEARDRLSLLSSYGFDASVMDLFGALLNGAALCPIDVRGKGSDLGGSLRRLGVTVYHSTPTVYRHLVTTDDDACRFPKIRLVVLGGEEALRSDVEHFRKRFSPEALLVNLAGQTESSLNLLYFVDRETSVERASLPIGYAVAETEVLLLDEAGAPTELRGEMGIRSARVAPGYWGVKDPRAFLPDPEGGERRIYRTGDYARFLADGSLEFLGRRDLQVKVRGFRVELGEVETLLAQHPGVAAAAASVFEAVPGDRRLAAHFVARDSPFPSTRALRDYLREKLPEHMVPGAFVRLEALPLTPSGKVDRRALPVPRIGVSEDRVRTAPRDPIEKALVSIFEHVLGTEGISVEDDFFDLGGHSLVAVRLFAELEKALAVRLPLATIFRAPTVETLARVLREKGRRVPFSSLVSLQPFGQLPPLFAVHGHSGEVLFYRDLARHLGPNQPFFALQAWGLGGGPAHRSIEAMATHYLEEMRTVQGKGPYSIGGYCMGAFVAFEMAQQLRTRGEEVSLLALFVGSGRDARGSKRPSRVGRLGRRASFHWGQARALRSGARLPYLLKKGRDGARALVADVGAGLWRLAYGLLGDTSAAPAWLLRNVGEMNLEAARRYRPRPYSGRMIVFLSGETPPGFRLDPEEDLDGLVAREIEVLRVPGATDTMMREPHVGALSAKLKACLEGMPAPWGAAPAA